MHAQHVPCIGFAKQELCYSKHLVTEAGLDGNVFALSLVDVSTLIHVPLPARKQAALQSQQ